MIEEFAYEGKVPFVSINKGDFDKVYDTSPLEFYVKKDNTILTNKNINININENENEDLKVNIKDIKNKFKHDSNEIKDNTSKIKKLKKLN